MRVNTYNLASLRVAQKAGFSLEGSLRRASLEEDGLHDVAVLALLDDEIQLKPRRGKGSPETTR